MLVLVQAARTVSGAIDAYLNRLPGPAPPPSPPPPPPSPPSPPAAVWRERVGLNCYGDRDGKGSHGAVDLEHPASSSAPGSPMSLSSCEKLCFEAQGCTGVTVAPRGNGCVS